MRGNGTRSRPFRHTIAEAFALREPSGSRSFSKQFMKAITALIAGGFFCASAVGAETSLVTLANPLQGTDDPVNFSHGNEYPAIALPFPMNVWAPYTEPASERLFYQ